MTLKSLHTYFLSRPECLKCAKDEEVNTRFKLQPNAEWTPELLKGASALFMMSDKTDIALQDSEQPSNIVLVGYGRQRATNPEKYLVYCFEEGGLASGPPLV